MATKPKKQSDLPGVVPAPVSIPEIDEASEDYVKQRDARMALTKKEVDARKKVSELMKKNGLTEYHYEGERLNEETGESETVERITKIEHKEKITVRVPKEDDESENESEEEQEAA